MCRTPRANWDLFESENYPWWPGKGRESEEKIEQLREMDSALSEPPVRDAQIRLHWKKN